MISCFFLLSLLWFYIHKNIRLIYYWYKRREVHLIWLHKFLRQSALIFWSIAKLYKCIFYSPFFKFRDFFIDLCTEFWCIRCSAATTEYWAWGVGKGGNCSSWKYRQWRVCRLYQWVLWRTHLLLFILFNRNVLFWR